MGEKIKIIVKQGFSFLIVSGVGWIFDFCTYFILTKIFNMNVMFANMISAIPALTYVFSKSSKKIFKNESSKLTLKYKYIIYFGYQILLVSLVSILGEVLFNWFAKIITIPIIANNLKIFIKLLITPITMTLNFIIMKNLIEKL